MQRIRPIAVSVFCAVAHGTLTGLVLVLLCVASRMLVRGSALGRDVVVLAFALCAMLLAVYFGSEVARRTGRGPRMAAAVGLLSLPVCVPAIAGVCGGLGFPDWATPESQPRLEVGVPWTFAIGLIAAWAAGGYLHVERTRRLHDAPQPSDDDSAT